MCIRDSSRYTFKREEEYSKNNTDLNANVFMFIGEYEQAGLGDPKDPNRYNMAVSYTHLDVYKRQPICTSTLIIIF